MKKTLLTLGVLGLMTLGFMACDSKNDCTCTVSLEDVPTTVAMDDFDGECEDITWSDLPSDWQNGGELGMKLSCVEK